MTETGISHSTPPVLTTIPIAESQSSMPARHRYHHSSKRRKSFTITLESVFMFAWNRRSRCAGNSVHGGPSRAAEHDGRNAKLSVMRRKLSLMLG